MDMFYYFTLAFQNYTRSNGRATRSEFWYFLLCHFLIIASLFILILVGIESGNDSMATTGGIALAFYAVAAIIPANMLAIRRLHDTGKSGWLLLLKFVPIVGSIILLILLGQESDGDNQWGDMLELEDYPEEELVLPIIEYDEFV